MATANLSRITGKQLLNAAVGTSDGHGFLFDNGAGNNAYRSFGTDHENALKVETKSMDTILAQHSDCVPFFLKVDIEGYEKQLFSGSPEWPEMFKVLAIETHDWMLPGQACSSSLLAELGGRDRDLLFRGENLFSVRNDD